MLKSRDWFVDVQRSILCAEVNRLICWSSEIYVLRYQAYLQRNKRVTFCGTGGSCAEVPTCMFVLRYRDIYSEESSFMCGGIQGDIMRYRLICLSAEVYIRGIPVYSGLCSRVQRYTSCITHSFMCWGTEVYMMRYIDWYIGPRFLGYRDVYAEVQRFICLSKMHWGLYSEQHSFIFCGTQAYILRHRRFMSRPEV